LSKIQGYIAFICILPGFWLENAFLRLFIYFFRIFSGFFNFFAEEIYYTRIMPANLFFFLLLFAFAAYGQQQKRVAVLNTEDDGDFPMEVSDLSYLTARLREIAGNILPKDKYSLMNAQSIIDMLGKEKARKICKEQCLAGIGRKVSADYVGQARLGRFGGDFTISMELYNSSSGVLVGSFTGDAKDVFGLLAIIDESAPILFKKFDKRFYSVKLSTDPTGADLSFDGDSQSSCITPCKIELPEGNVHITADLEDYETADTTVSIKQNNQSINIKLKPNFGILEIKPAYSGDIGKDEQWSLTLNGQPFYSLENKLPADKYKGELSHRCYEDISFNIGVSKGKRQVFDMAKQVKLKKGDRGSVPLCAEVEDGDDSIDYRASNENVVQKKTFTDSRDGQKYEIVKIGKQTWMAENLNYNASGSECYDNDPANCQECGKLYNWAKAKEVCPKGWHLPNNKEWDALTTAVGGKQTAGKLLKATSGWNSYNGESGNGTDAYSFNALPCGYGFFNGESGNAGYEGYWWSSDNYYDKRQPLFNAKYYRYMDGSYEVVEKWDAYIHNSAILFSVRCLKD